MNEENSVFDDIERYQQQGRLVFFVGSGVSRPSEYPSWEGLVQSMADEIKYDYKKNSKNEAEFSSDELLKIPQMFYNQQGEKKYKKFVEKKFSGIFSPNEVHRKIFEFSPSHILTTNYDCLLEDDANMVDKHYSIINSDSAIDKVENPNYIVKVHGDFSADFVLKEDDYLNYENNYKLIDNLVKSIFSTNLVIFVGYSLADYNIKLIFNWVKKYQGNKFKPIFIYNGENKIDINNRNYLESKGLRVIDSHDFVNSPNNFVCSSEAFKSRYLETLTGLIKGKNLSGDRPAILKYIYNKIKPVKGLAYIRKKDFDSIFNKKYTLDYWEDLGKNEEEYEKLDEKSDKKYLPEIKQFIDKNCNQYKGSVGYNISEAAFLNKFEDMKIFCKEDYSSLQEKMKKAYYLAVLGEYVESYNLYTELFKNWTRVNTLDTKS